MTYGFPFEKPSGMMQWTSIQSATQVAEGREVNDELRRCDVIPDTGATSTATTTAGGAAGAASRFTRTSSADIFTRAECIAGIVNRSASACCLTRVRTAVDAPGTSASAKQRTCIATSNAWPFSSHKIACGFRQNSDHR
jgi:hypothetical protein